MFYAYTLTEQTVAADEAINLNTDRLNDCYIYQHAAGTPTISFSKCGTYKISVNCVATSDTVGDLTIQLFNNDVEVPGALATIGINTANAVNNFTFTAVVRVLPSCAAIDNTARLTVKNTGANTATVSNIAVLIERL